MIRKIRMICLLLALCMVTGILCAKAETNGVSDTIEAQEMTATEGIEENMAAEAPVETTGQIDSKTPIPQQNDFLGFLKGYVRLFNREIPVWFLIAACAILIVLVILLILLIVREKGKKNSLRDISGKEGEESLTAYITSPDTPGSQILTIGDEPTMDLNSVDGQGVIFGEDEPTTDLKESEGYILKARMFFHDVYLDKELKMAENDQAIIGRSSEATIQTNPADTSISHRHGTFTATEGVIIYRDESRNGTKYNGQRMIHKDESITIPLNTKVQIEMGEHRILLLAAREH